MNSEYWTEKATSSSIKQINFKKETPCTRSHKRSKSHIDFHKIIERLSNICKVMNAQITLMLFLHSIQSQKNQRWLAQSSLHPLVLFQKIGNNPPTLSIYPLENEISCPSSLLHSAWTDSHSADLPWGEHLIPYRLGMQSAAFCS